MESRQRNKRQRDGLTDELALEGLEVASAGKKQYKHGRYTNKEMEILKQGYVMIAMENGLDPDNIDYEKIKKKLGNKRMEELMPGRAPELVRSKLKRYFHPDNYKGVYSPQEDAMLLSMVREHGCDWIRIGAVLERFHTNVRDRYREIQEDYKKGEWSQHEKEQLEAVIKLCHHGEVPEEDIQWCAVSARMKTRSRQQCRTKWHIVKLEKLRSWDRQADIALVRSVMEQEAEDESEVLWTLVTVNQRRGRACSERFFELVKYVADYRQTDFEKLCKMLKRHLKWEHELLMSSIELDEKLAAGKELMIEPPSPKRKKQLSLPPATHSKAEELQTRNKQQPQVVSSEEELPDGLKMSKAVRRVLKAAPDMSNLSVKQVRSQIEVEWNIQMTGEVKQEFKTIVAKAFVKMIKND